MSYMKLRGTNTENRIRSRLLESRKWLKTKDASSLRKVLDENDLGECQFFVLSHLPEQLEDHYFLFDGKKLFVSVVIEHDPGIHPEVESWESEEYTKSLRKQNAIEVMVARQIVDSET